jgi:adenylate kinase
MRLVFLGPPGSGKGTEAILISERMDLVHVSTGEVLREEIGRRSDLGRQIEAVVSSGRLVDDEIVNRIVFARISGLEGFILDGYPRNVDQASRLDDFLGSDGLTGVVHLSVPDEVVEKRLSGRRVCRHCGFVGNTSHLRTDSCPECGEKLAHRRDDRPDRVRKRLEVYREETAPLLEYYAGRLADIDGTGSKEEVASRIEEGLARWA